MANSHYHAEIDPLALALTRPPMLMGVNIRVFFANVVLCTLICINAHTLWGGILFVVLHLLMVRISSKEPNFFYVWAMALMKTPPVINSGFWGKVNSYEAW